MFFSRSGGFRVPEPLHNVVLRHWQQGVSWLHLEGTRRSQESSRRFVGKGSFGNGWIPPNKTIRYLNVSIYINPGTEVFRKRFWKMREREREWIGSVKRSNTGF
ncbi:unnamed protein product [Boreogadus saida]